MTDYTDDGGHVYRLVTEEDGTEQVEYLATCPACGSPIDYCQGHGEIGDPAGFAILEAHDDGQHDDCHPDGCDDRPSDRDWLKSMMAKHGHGGA